jgi:Trypsin
VKNIFYLLFLLPLYSSAGPDVICGGTDDRVPLKDLRIGRLIKNKDIACTVTLISASCAISAGHCEPFMDGTVEFDVPLSVGSIITQAKAENTYLIDQASIRFRNFGEGRDWSVFKLLPNEKTLALAGAKNGFYPVSFTLPSEGEKVFVAGYGKDDRVGVKTYATLQMDSGILMEVAERTEDSKTSTVLVHNADTTPGDSGAAVIRVKQRDIVGVHTHGYLCGKVDGNTATPVASAVDFKRALKECLGN